ncbi:DeoR/GlpR family DNA-binding transcription regulator [Paenibacillus dakarensis]|uniref:DeoR/GlpR family DNA-binding transcription regulator n=1 Tax=Paenibacillus dakarensis TaxID=1527293 RepID=UPI0006D56CEE|nr:DeoR/GlpR family DNA-binding transcription regulator [Paenibacillus dakarensis]
MLTEERYRLILERLQEQGVVKLQELVELLNASESTVRRDLVDLEAKNLLKRVHGGASLMMQKSIELGMDEKTFKNIHEKNVTAKRAAERIQDGDCIYLDAGTTTLAMIPYIKAKEITVVTNGLSHVDALVSRNIRSYLLGGLMKIHTKAVVGSIAIQNMEQFRCDKSFIGTNGIDVKMGYTTPDPEEALLKRTAHNASGETYVLADSSKFGKITFAKMFDLEEATLVTDKIPDPYKVSIGQKYKVIEG